MKFSVGRADTWTVLVAVSCVSVACRAANCSLPVNIHPCTCAINNGKSWFTCQSVNSLHALIEVLNKMSGYHIDRFELAMSDIKYLPSNLFLGLSIAEIYIQNTNISRFTEAGRSAFYGLEKTLSTLLMKRCALLDHLQWEKIGALDGLTTLDLSSNRLTTVPPQWSDYPPEHLEFLYLRNNNITAMNDNALASVYNLVSLDLAENQLVTLKRSMLPNPANNLVYLYLSYNSIESLPGDIFHEMFSLKRVYLDNNRIQVLKEDVWLPVWTQLQVLDLLGNRMSCDCSMAWMLRLQKPKVMYGKCEGPRNLRNKELHDLWPWSMTCDLKTTSG